jgi:hypothetical protein
LSNILPARTKYKIGISIDANRQLIMKTVCFFCNNGFPKIINLPLQNPTMFNYFLNYVLNLNGKLLRITSPLMKSRIVFDISIKDGVNNGKSGMWLSLFTEFLIPKLNFTYNIFISSGKDGPGRGGGTGLQLENGTWIGLL